MPWTAKTAALFSVTAICVLSHAFSAFGTLITVIVDDQDPSISYTSKWNIGQTCTVCDAGIDKSQIYNGTWSDNTYLSDDNPQNATFKFNGTNSANFWPSHPDRLPTGSAIFVYGAQEQLLGKNSADVLFYIDEQLASTYTFTPSGTEDVAKYGQLLFSQENLGEAPHTLVLQNGRVGGAQSLVLGCFTVAFLDAFLESFLGAFLRSAGATSKTFFGQKRPGQNASRGVLQTFLQAFLSCSFF